MPEEEKFDNLLSSGSRDGGNYSTVLPEKVVNKSGECMNVRIPNSAFKRRSAFCAISEYSDYSDSDTPFAAIFTTIQLKSRVQQETPVSKNSVAIWIPVTYSVYNN